MTTLTEGMPIPRTVAICPYCDGDLYISGIDEWDAETGAPTESGIHIACINENMGDPDDHTAMPYVNWLPVQMVVWRHYKDTPRLTWRVEQQDHTLCQHPGCTNDAIPCWLPDNDNGDPDDLFCAEHAVEHGYCAGCGQFCGGIESFDFGPYAGLCDNCASEAEYQDRLDEDWPFHDEEIQL